MKTIDELKKELVVSVAPNFKGSFEVLLGFIGHDTGSMMVENLCKMYAIECLKEVHPSNLKKVSSEEIDAGRCSQYVAIIK